jgi:predicted permease
MGCSLAAYPLRGELPPAAALAALKLAVHPFLVWLVAVPILGIEGLWVSVAIVLAGMPSAVNTYIFAARYEAAADVAARTVLLASSCSMATIAVLLALVGG